MINLPYVEQPYSSAWCGPASLLMVCKYYNIPATKNKLIKLCNTCAKWGTVEDDFESAAQKLGLELDVLETGCSRDQNKPREAQIRHIRRFLDQGVPLVGVITLNGAEDHYAPIIGIDDKHIYFNDSIYGENYPRSLDELLPGRLRWIAGMY